jgi:superfamily II DNA helicase RecQ
MWINNMTRVMIATIAFGMVINKTQVSCEKRKPYNFK